MKSFGLLTYCIISAIYPAGAKTPNVVILFADDLGYGDLGAYGHPTSSTPNLDNMAQEGLVFTQFYSASPVCSPSRAALLTGRYQTRSGIWPGVFGADSVGGLPLNETTIAEYLNSVGYKSAIVGKWHLGVGEGNMYLPTNQGFSYYMGIPYSHDMCPCYVCFYPAMPCYDKCRQQDSPCPLFENSEIIQQPADFTKLTETYVNAATSFVKSNAAKQEPFFLYMAFQHTHHPQFSGKMFTNSSIRGTFGDALSELDWGVGQILSTLKELDIEDNTFVFFTADNGPSLTRQIRGGNAGTLKCGKGSTWEGGMREPAIAWWPGTIKQGRTMELAATVDLLPTILQLTGAAGPPKNLTLDGVDMSPILFQNNLSNRDHYIYYPSGADPDYGIYAIRWKQYKAHFYTSGGLCPNFYPIEVCRGNYSRHQHNPPLLYNIEEDPGEIYPLDVSKYHSVITQIIQLKSSFESGMVWGESQMHRGSSSNVMPCATPGCSPFPSCCHTSIQTQTSKYLLNTSRATG